MFSKYKRSYAQNVDPREVKSYRSRFGHQLQAHLASGRLTRAGARSVLREVGRISTMSARGQRQHGIRGMGVSTMYVKRAGGVRGLMSKHGVRRDSHGRFA